MMTRKQSVAAALVGLFLPWAQAAAQRAELGTVELGGFAKFTNFDEGAGCPCRWPLDAFGLGARAGVFVSDLVALELDATKTRADRAIVPGKVRYTTVATRVNLNVPSPWPGESVSLIAGAGPVRSSYDGDPRWGASGLAGVRWMPFERVGARLDGVADFMPREDNLNLIARAGVSVFLRQAPEPAAVAVAPPLPPVRPAEPPPPPPIEAESPAEPPAPDPLPALAAEGALNRDREAVMRILATPVYFDFDSDRIRPDAEASLRLKANLMTEDRTMRLLVIGNADERGSAPYNFELGMRRAEAVVQYLVRQGVERERLVSLSHGNTQLSCIEANPTERCHQVNRRVDFSLLPVTADDQ